MPLVRYECPKCGGANCGHDATAFWDDAAQAWALGSIYDNGWCSDCGDVEPKAVPLSRADAARVRIARSQLPINALAAGLRTAERALTVAISALASGSADPRAGSQVRDLRGSRTEVRAAIRKARAA